MTTWLLARFPRPIVVSLTALFEALIVTIVLLVFALIAAAVCAGLFSAMYWVWVITGGEISPDTSLVGLQLSCAGALSVPAGVFVYIAWSFLKDADEEVPRREKKS